MGCSQYFMQIKQLQALALQCRQLLRTIQDNHHSYPSKTPSIEQAIRERRKEVAQLKQEIKGLRLQQKKQKQLNKNIRAAQKQLERMKALAAKEEAHYKQLNKLCQRLAQNILDQKTKTAQLVEEETTMKEYQTYAEEGLQMTNQYQMLKEKFNQSTKQSLQMRGNWEQEWRSRKQWVKAIDKNNVSIDEKIHFLGREIDTQHEIIEGIHQMERDHQTISRERLAQDEGQFSILQKQARVFFQKSTNLSVWEKHQVTNLLQRKQLEKDKQARRIGSIFRQRFTEHRSHNSLIKQKKQLNYSTDVMRTANKSTLQRYKPSLFHFVSNDRIKQLENNKRIRTRYTEPAQPLSKAKTNHLQTVVQDLREEQPQKQSIITIYERLKRQKQLGTSSVLKFQRLQNKRKSLRKRRGVPIESQHF